MTKVTCYRTKHGCPYTYTKKSNATGVGKVVEKEEHSSIAGGIAN